MDLDGNCTTESGAPKVMVDGTAITLHIDKVGLKDAESGYIQPQVKVTVVGGCCADCMAEVIPGVFREQMPMAWS